MALTPLRRGYFLGERMKLTPAQEEFARWVVELGNASEAYRRAYPRSKAWKPQAIHVAASQLLAKDKVAIRVDQLKEEKAKEFKAEAKKQGLAPEDIIREQAHTAFFDPVLLFDQDGRLLPLHKMPEIARRAVKSVKIRGIKSDDDSVQGVIAEIQMWDKLTALRHLGEHLGMYKQVHEHHWIEELARMSDEELAHEEALARAELERALQERQALGERLNG